MKNQSSQTKDILNYMISHGGISGAQAFQLFGCMHLPGIIYSLRKQGYEIESITNTSKNRYGRNVNYTVYCYRSSQNVEEWSYGKY